MDNEPPELIRKLAALANHPNTPPEEAAAARRKLRTLLTKYGLTESDLASERKIEWVIPRVEPYEKELLSFVVSMILDTWMPPGKIRKTGKCYQFQVATAVADQIDIEACFSYYRKILRSDRLIIQQEAAVLRGAIKKAGEQIKTLSAAMKKLPDVMQGKYRIYPPRLERDIRDLKARREAEAHAEETEKAPPAKAPTPKQQAAFDKEWEARRAASRRMGNHDAWQKGEALAGQFALES